MQQQQVETTHARVARTELFDLAFKSLMGADVYMSSVERDGELLISMHDALDILGNKLLEYRKVVYVGDKPFYPVTPAMVDLIRMCVAAEPDAGRRVRLIRMVLALSSTDIGR